MTAINQAAPNRGVKVLCNDFEDLTPPKETAHAMQALITADVGKARLDGRLQRPRAYRHQQGTG